MSVTVLMIGPAKVVVPGLIKNIQSVPIVAERIVMQKEKSLMMNLLAAMATLYKPVKQLFPGIGRWTYADWQIKLSHRRSKHQRWKKGLLKCK